MALTQQQKTDAYQFFIIAFGAAPGTEYLSQLDEAYSAGMTTKQIVNVYTTKPQFLALYPEALTTAEFANNLVENVVGANASEAAKAEAKSDVIGALNAGWSKGDVVYQIFSNLASKPVTDTAWGQTSAMFANKVAVAAYVTETLKVSTTDLATLQAYVAPVTSAPESVTAAEAFAITADASTVNEGGMVIFNIANGVANTEYAIKLGGVQAADITGDLVRVVTTDAAGKASLEVAIAADSATEGAETLTASVLTKTATASVVINDTSVNTAPTVTAGQIFTIVEGSAAAAAVGTVVATDVEGDAISYAITSGNDAGLFAINAATGAITLTAAGAAALDREGAVNSYSLGITATDAKSNVGTQTPVTITVGDASDVAPVAVAATAAANEAGAVVTGNLTATDVDTVDAGKLTYELKAAVEGLTINADGSYSFDPKLNTVANGLTYDQVDGVNIPATFIVTDSGGNKGEGTLTINVKPVPLSFKIEANKASAEEGATTTYTVTASEALTQAVNVEFTLQPGDGAAANTGTKETNTADFATGAFNPKTVQIKAGEKTATFDVVAVNDANTELQEGYTVQAVIAGQPTMTLGGKVVDATGAGGVGQTFTLTTGIDTIPGMIGSAASAGTDGNDIIIGLLDNTGGSTKATLTTLDAIDGGLGNDTLRLDDLGASSALPGGLTVTNVENITIRGAGAVTLDTTAWTGVTSLKSTLSTSAILTADKATAVDVSGSTGAVVVDGGASQTVNTAGTTVTLGAATVSTGAIAVTHTKQATNAIAVDGGSTVSINASGVTGGTVAVGQGGAATDLATGAVTITSAGAAYVAATTDTLGAITVTGGTTVSVTQSAFANTTDAAKDATAGTRTQSAVNVTGGNATTAVTVVQDAAVTAVNAVTAVAPVKQVDTVTSIALAKGETATVGGLTFTASKALAAAEVAAAFANLSAGDKQGDAPASNGIYSGTFGNYTTGAVITTGNVVTVEATAKTAAAPAAAIAVSDTSTNNIASAVKTAGAAEVKAVTGVAGIVGGAVVVADGAATTDTIKTVTLDGYGAGSTVASDALTGLNLANSAQALTVTNTKATSLDLSLNNVTGAAAIGLGTAYTTLNVATAGKDSAVALNATAATALTLSGTQHVDFTGSTFTALKTATVTGAAGATGNVSTLASFTGFDASATSGKNTITIDATKATYKGGSGVDDVTLSAATPSKAVSLGAGNDTLKLAAGTTATAGGVVLDGGDGTDTLVMDSADAVTASAAITFETQITGFEVLSLRATATAGTVDLANLDDISTVISAGNTAALTLKNMANAGNVIITGAATTTDVQLTSTSGTSDSLTLQVVGGVDVGTVKAAGVETINVMSNGGAAANTVKLQTAAATTVNVTGSQNLNLDLHGDTIKLTLVDASALTGNLTTTTNGTVAQTVKGGLGDDTITANFTGDVLQGGAGNDTLKVAGKSLVQLTGGAGVDTFDVSVATSNSSSYATILDLAKGDLIKFSAVAADFKAAKINLAATAVFQDYANEAVKTSAKTNVSWFQFGGDTYVVENVSAGTSFTNGTDIIVKITGAVDLSTASFSSTNDTLEII